MPRTWITVRPRIWSRHDMWPSPAHRRYNHNQLGFADLVFQESTPRSWYWSCDLVSITILVLTSVMCMYVSPGAIACCFIVAPPALLYLNSPLQYSVSQSVDIVVVPNLLNSTPCPGRREQHCFVRNCYKCKHIDDIVLIFGKQHRTGIAKLLS